MSVPSGVSRRTPANPPAPAVDRQPFAEDVSWAQPASAYRITVAGWQVIRLGGWTAGSGRCGWPGPARPRPLPAGLGTSGSTGSASSLRMPYGPVMRCGCAAKDVNASWLSSRLSPSVSAHRGPPRATSTTALPFCPARRLSRWLFGTAARAVRPSASAGVSRSCSGGRPAEPVSGRAAKTGLPRRTDVRACGITHASSAATRACRAERAAVGSTLASCPRHLQLSGRTGPAP